MAEAAPLLLGLAEGPLTGPALTPAAIVGPARGAVASFLGVVRNHARGRAVTQLHYEAYRPMAQRQLERFAAEARERFGAELAVAITHGLGTMRPGEVSVAIHCGAAHRAPALQAVAHLIERLKADLPVWKQQTFADGTVEWVAGS